jgi:hypothetical protein
MSVFQRKGKEVAENLARQAYFDKRRAAVGRAWAEYMSEALERNERGEKEQVRYGFDALSDQTDAYIKREAERWARSCRKYRIYEDDFESQFRYTVAKSALSFQGEYGTFFDYLRTSINNAGRDLVRHALTKKNRINHLAESLDDEKVARKVDKQYTSRSAEDEAIPRIIVAEMAADTTLNEQERKLFEFLRIDPDATLQEMADGIGVRDRKQASRVKARLADKLRKYL